MKGLGLMLATTLLLLSACSQPQLPRPPANDVDSLNLTGLWRGRVQDNIGGSGVDLSLTEEGGQIEGELLLRFGLAQVRGSVSGIIDEGQIHLLLTPEDRNYCPYRAVATQQGDRLQGNYEGVGCRSTIIGTLELRKQ